MQYCAEQLRLRSYLTDTEYSRDIGHIVLHGPPGTGKTAACKDLPDSVNVIFSATTGAAAQHMQDGRVNTPDGTIKVPATTIASILTRFTSKIYHTRQAITRCFTTAHGRVLWLFIDEFSMLTGPDIIRLKRLAVLLPCVRCVFMGDMRQLRNDVSKANPQPFYTLPEWDFFFNDKTVCIVFTKVFRYADGDEEYGQVASDIREGKWTDRVYAFMLQAYKRTFSEEESPTYIVGTNSAADGINAQYLAALPGPLLVATYHGARVEFRLGSRVMCVQNIREGDELLATNGTTGYLTDFTGKLDACGVCDLDKCRGVQVSMETDDGSIVTFPILQNQYNSDKKHIIIRLADANTCHKNQGATINTPVVIDTRRFWQPEQFTVAFSRASSRGLVKLASFDPDAMKRTITKPVPQALQEFLYQIEKKAKGKPSDERPRKKQRMMPTT